MLYDPSKNESEKPPVMSIAGLISWLETQDPETTYDWFSCTECLIGRYLTAMDALKLFLARRQNRLCFHEVFDSDVRAYIDIAHSMPRSYGAALKRALDFQAGLPVGDDVSGRAKDKKSVFYGYEFMFDNV